MRRIFIAVTVALAVMGDRPASAQIVVHDSATTARNTNTAVLKEMILATQQQQHERLRRMATRLSAHASLDRYVPANPPLWPARGPGRSLYAEAYNEALVSGDPSGSAYLDLAHQLMAAHSVLDRLESRPRRWLATQLASVDAADATIVAATHDVGRLRANGRDHELRSIDSLETHVSDPSSTQSATAVLDKIAGAGLVGARQRQARVRLLVAVVEQLLLDGKRARDIEAAVINAQLATWHGASAVNHAFAVGAADALRTWRQP